MYAELGDLFCRSLVGFHALTGCDFNPAFFRKGKQRPLKLLRKCEQFEAAFDEIGSLTCNVDVVFPIVEKFICNLYSLKNLNSVNRARFALFLKTYKFKNLNEPFEKKKIKNFDASSIPPCYAELKQHLLRSIYIARIWRNAHAKIPSFLQPEDYGWIQVDNKYEFKWFEGQQLPDTIKDVVIDTEATEGKKLPTYMIRYSFKF